MLYFSRQVFPKVGVLAAIIAYLVFVRRSPANEEEVTEVPLATTFVTQVNPIAHDLSDEMGERFEDYEAKNITW
jgi:hypothetical protein